MLSDAFYQCWGKKSWKGGGWYWLVFLLWRSSKVEGPCLQFWSRDLLHADSRGCTEEFFSRRKDDSGPTKSKICGFFCAMENGQC